jgi:hypothetical protein
MESERAERRRMINRVLTAGLAGAAALLASAPASANHSWGGYHWARTINPFTVKLGDNVGGAWKSALGGASTDWTKSSVLDAPVVTGGVSNTKTCKPTPGRVEVCSNAYGRNGWLGVAQIWLSGDHITQGVTKLNDSYFGRGSVYDTPAWRNLVTCQEVGHTFGLDHQDENFNNANLGTCMDYTNSPESNQHPNAHDYEELEDIYAHTDFSSTSFASTPGAAPQADGGLNPGEWGRAVAFTAEGRGRVFEKSLGGGRKLVTFVFWVREQGGRPE